MTSSEKDLFAKLTHNLSQDKWGKMPELSISQESTERMDATIIDNINSLVMPNDILWILGDFTFAPKKIAQQYRDRIKCKTVNLIFGSHDRRSGSASIGPVFNITSTQYELNFLYNGKRQLLVLNHYPMYSWFKSHYGSGQLFGHHHGRFKGIGRSMDVGVDVHNFKPISLDQVMRTLGEKEYIKNKSQDIREKGDVVSTIKG